MKNFLLYPLIFLFFIFIAPKNYIYGNQDSTVFIIDSIPGEIELNKYWKYKPGDDTLWAAYNYNDDNWDTTLKTTIDLSEIPEDKFTGFGWFRLHLQIDSSLRNKTFALTIDQQGASEIYLNGKLITHHTSHGIVGTKKTEEKTYNPKSKPTLIEFRDSINYVLAIRYSNLKANKNYKTYRQKIAGFTITIIDYSTAVNQIAVYSYIGKVFVAIFTVFIVIALLHLLLYLFYRRQRSNLYFFLFMIAVSMMWIIVLYTLSASGEPTFTMKLVFYLKKVVALSFPVLSIFIYSIYYPKLPKITRVILGFIPVVLVLSFMDGSWTTKVASFINLLIMLDIIRNIVKAIIKKKKGAWIVAGGFLLFIFFFLLVAIFGLTSQQNIETKPGSLLGIVILSTFVPGIISVPLSMSIYLARDFAGTSRNLEKQLENVKVLSAKTLEQEREKQRILENQKEKLEIMVDERTKELALEKEKTEELLLNTLPLKVVNELKQNGKSEPESFDNVSVYFSDIVGFTSISSSLEPTTLISELSDMFTVFDDIMAKHQCERIKTIGDAYLAVSGMPLKNENHAENMIKAAAKIKEYMEERNKTTKVKWKIRIGIHSGKVVGGIVGVRKYIYDVFGDTINTASRMESNSEPMRINVSEATYSILKDQFQFVERDAIEVKGKGIMKMYFLDI